MARKDVATKHLRRTVLRIATVNAESIDECGLFGWNMPDSLRGDPQHGIARLRMDGVSGRDSDRGLPLVTILRLLFAPSPGVPPLLYQPLSARSPCPRPGMALLSNAFARKP